MDLYNRPEHFPPPPGGYDRLSRLIIYLQHSIIPQLLLILLDKICAFILPSYFLPRNVFLITQPRSGSTLLLATMARDPRIWCKGEILNSLYQRYGTLSTSSWRRKLHVRAVLSRFPAACINIYRSFFCCGRRRPLIKAVFVKVFLYHVMSPNEIVTLEYLLNVNNKTSCVRLYRQCMLSTYASLQVALRNDVWVKTTEDYSSNLKESTIDINIREFVEFANEQRYAWQQLDEIQSINIDGWPKHSVVVSYEELSRNPTGTSNNVKSKIQGEKGNEREYTFGNTCSTDLPYIQNSHIPLKDRVHLVGDDVDDSTFSELFARHKLLRDDVVMQYKR